MNTIYPKIPIKSKSELAKHLSCKGNHVDILNKINAINKNFNKYYSNHKLSKIEEKKYIRKAKSYLRELNILINDRILKKYDSIVPCFIYWWISKKNYLQAVSQHCFNEKRTFIKLDVERFFDQIDYNKVLSVLMNKIWCSYRWAKQIANLCCVPETEFFDEKAKKVIARWFPTSSRLAVLSSIEFFEMLNYKVNKYFKLLKPRISVFVDDISISFLDTSDDIINKFLLDVNKLEKKYNIYLKKEKEEIIRNTSEAELLWTKIKDWELFLWKKSREKARTAYKRFYNWDKSDKIRNKIRAYKNLRIQLKKAL